MAERGLVPELPSPHPLLHMLPSIHRDDDFIGRFTGGLDTVVAPVLNTLDCLDAYLDPKTAPTDFLDWLTSWLGLVPDHNWTDERRRLFVDQVGELYKWRGTPRGLADAIELYVGRAPEILDSGGVVGASRTGAQPPGQPSPTVTARISVDDPSSVDHSLLAVIIALAVPAHVAATIEVVGLDGPEVS